jgi:hypothetical protein
MRFNPYDDVQHKSITKTSVALQSLTGSSEVDSDTVDTAQAFIAESIMLHIRAEIASGSPSTSTLTWALQESNDDGSADAYAAAADNSGTTIGGTVDVKTVAKDIYARVECINLRNNSASAAPYGGRKRYLRVALTPTFTGGSSPAILAYAELIGTPGNGAQRPVRTTVSNT